MIRRDLAGHPFLPFFSVAKLSTLLFVPLFFVGPVLSASAQITNVTNTTSTPIPGAGHDYIKMLSETVNPANGSVSVRIQTPTPPGRGMSFPFSFAYDSNGAAHITSDFTGEPTWSDNSAYLSTGGWSYSVPMVSNLLMEVPIQPHGYCGYYMDYVFQDPTAGRHSLGISYILNPGVDACGSATHPPVQMLTGGDDYYQASLGTTTLSVADFAGTVYAFPPESQQHNGVGNGALPASSLPSQIEDRNGNQVVVTDMGLQQNGVVGSFTVTDPLGRTLLSSSGFGVSGDTVAVSGLSVPYSVTWGTATRNFSVNTWLMFDAENACYSTFSADANPGNVITGIKLPDGESYQFSYDSVYGMLNKITYPSGGYVQYTWGVNPRSEAALMEDSKGEPNDCTYQFDSPAVTKRTVSFDGTHTALTQSFAYTTTWSSSPQTWTTKTTTITTTDNITGLVSIASDTYSAVSAPYQPNDSRSFDAQIPVEQTSAYKNSGGPTLRTVTKSWYDQYELKSQQTALDNSQTNETTYLYGSGAQVTDKKEYDYGSGAPGALLRETVTNYQVFKDTPLFTTGPSIFNRPCQIIVKDGSGNRDAETDYFYDNGGTGTVCGTAGTPSVTAVSGLTKHDETNYGASSTAARGNVTQKTQWAGTGTSPVTKYTYDEAGQVLSMTDPCGNSTCSDMGGSSHTATYGYSDSYTILTGGSNISYTPTGTTDAYLTKITDTLGHTESFEYDFNNGQLTKSTDANSQPTTYIYNDAFARPTQFNYPDTGQTQYSYSDAPPSPSVTTTKLISSGTNLTTETIMDGLGHVVQNQLTSDPNCTTGDITATTYDGTGHVYTISNPYCTTGDPTYGLTTNTYDALGRVTQLTHPDSTYISTSYTGRATAVSDEGNGTRSVQRISQVDGLGRMTSVCEVTSTALVGISGTPAACGQDIATTGFLTSYSYDALNDLTAVAQGGLNGRSFGYDSLSRITGSENPETGTISYSYDVNGNLATRTAPKENQTGTATLTTTYTYDALNRLTSKSYSDSTPAVSYYYDQNNPWSQTVTNYIGRLTETEVFSGTTNLAGSVYSYDPMGRIANEFQCTPLDCGTSATYFAYTYDLLGDLITGWNNTDNITYTNAYNKAAELISVQSSLDDSQHPETLVTLSSFTAFQKPQQINYGNGVDTSLGYNTRLWLYFSNQGTLYDYNLIGPPPSYVSGYAPNGDILYANDSVNGDWTYTYDDLNRLVTGSCNTTYGCPTAEGFTYTYDRYGNRYTESVTKGSGVQPSYTYNANNQVITNNSYDAAGNVINDGLGNSYTYDAENRIIAATNGSYTASYVYDAFGHRVRSTVNGQTRDFLYDLSGRTIDQITAGTLTRSEAYAGDRHVGTYADNTTYFDSSDWLNTFRVRTNVSGSVVESCTSLPFGEDLTCNFSNFDVSPLHFTGKERDTESGLDMFGARYYGSSLGRFMTPDWAAKPTNVPYAHFGNPQSLNLYSYVQNNPTTVGDPDGHCAEDACVVETLAGATILVMATQAYFAMPASQRDFGTSLSQAASSVGSTIKSWFSSSNSGATTQPKDVYIDPNKYPASAGHVADAQAAGHPDVLTVDRPGASDRRADATAGHATQPGTDRDEYPPAVTREGGTGASVQNIPSSDNRGSGASLGNQISDVPNGGQIRVIPQPPPPPPPKPEPQSN